MFPQQTNSEYILEKLDERAAEIPDWSGVSGIERLGYAMTRPNPIALRALSKFLPINSNNIGIHDQSEHLAGTRALEAEVIQDALSLLNGNINDHGGYITSGGTEGNIYGQWLGRELLGKDARVIINKFTHSSNIKAANLLGLDVVELPTKNGKFDLTKLEKFLTNERNAIIIIATAGYYSTGMVDDIPAINRLIARNSICRYMHVDAAIGGYVLPFSNPNVIFDFRNSHVGSISIDPHKNGGVPYSGGIITYSRTAQAAINHYNNLAHQPDTTLLGSRAGAVAAAVWAVHRGQGFEGFQKSIKECLKIKQLFMDALYDYDSEAIFISNPDINHFAVSFSNKKKQRLIDLEQKYRLVSNYVFFNGAENAYYHFYIMPHISTKTVDRFIKDLHGKT